MKRLSIFVVSFLLCHDAARAVRSSGDGYSSSAEEISNSERQTPYSTDSLLAKLQMNQRPRTRPSAPTYPNGGGGRRPNTVRDILPGGSGRLYNEGQQNNPFGNYMSHLREELGRIFQVAQQLRSLRNDIIDLERNVSSTDNTTVTGNYTLYDSNSTRINDIEWVNNTTSNVTFEPFNSITSTLRPACVNRSAGFHPDNRIYFPNEELSQFSNLTLESAQLFLPFSGVPETSFLLDELTLLFSLKPKNKGRSRRKTIFAYERAVSDLDTNFTLDVTKHVKRWITNSSKNRGFVVDIYSSLGDPVMVRNFMKLQPDCKENLVEEIAMDHGLRSNFMFIPTQLTDSTNSKAMELPSLHITFSEPRSYNEERNTTVGL